MRIEYDDHELDIIAKVNEDLKPYGLEFVMREEAKDECRDGFELFDLRKIESKPEHSGIEVRK